MIKTDKAKEQKGKWLLPAIALCFWLCGVGTQAEEEQQQQNTQTFVNKWEQDVSLKGLYDSAMMYFQTGEWDVLNGQITLHINTSQLVDGEVSYLSILLDGQPVDTFSLTETGKKEVTFHTAIPLQMLSTPGWHSLTVEAYLRGTQADACEDDTSQALWMNLFADSRVEITFVPTVSCEHIMGFYNKFGSLEALQNQQSILAVGKGAGEASLTAAANILTGLAQNAVGDYGQIQTQMIEKEQDIKENTYLLYISRYDSLPDFLKEYVPQQQAEEAAKGAVILLVHYKETPILLVTGNDNEALKQAGYLLSNPDLVFSLNQTSQVVKAGENYRMKDYVWEEYIPLTDTGVQVKGNFEQSVGFFIECPANRILAASAQLSLDYRYSANLNFEKSLVTVYINGIPIGSRKLTKEGADGSSELFDIPGDVGAVGDFSVEIRFALYPEAEDWCELTPEQIPWGYVADTSMLKCTTMENTELFFEYFPFPFLRNGQFSETVVVLPESWEEEDLRVMAGLLLTLGGWQKSNAGDLKVMCGALPEELKNLNIISIGNRSRNLLDTTELLPMGKNGCAGLFLSPYSDHLHGLLIITGEENSDMEKTLSFFGNSARLGEVRGDLFKTNTTEGWYRYLRQPAAGEADLPETETPNVEAAESPFLIVCSVLLLTLLSAAMLLIKYGGGKDNEE